MHRLAALLALFVALPAFADARTQFDRFIEETRSFTADFVQTTRSKGRTQTTQGTVEMARPDHFRWEYRQPEPQLIVGDGKSIWVYDEELAQVTVKDQKTTLGETPAALLAGSTTVTRHYTVAEAGEKNGFEWLEATPKSKDQSYAKVRMAFAANELRVMELTDFTGQLTHIEFSRLVKNANIPAEKFRFTPPKGTDVLHE